jgi:hypothetical protein
MTKAEGKLHGVLSLSNPINQADSGCNNTILTSGSIYGVYIALASAVKSLPCIGREMTKGLERSESISSCTYVGTYFFCELILNANAEADADFEIPVRWGSLGFLKLGIG